MKLAPHGPHPEEPCAARRLEGWPLARPRPWPSFETAAQEGGLLRTRLMDDIDMVRTHARAARFALPTLPLYGSAGSLPLRLVRIFAPARFAPP
jgi:hypothetical protein